MEQQKYLDKYRIPSARLPSWDYHWAGAYLITICTKDRKNYFGAVMEERMFLSQQGMLADDVWQEIPHHAPKVSLGAYQIMPNHLHGILILNSRPDIVVETLHATSLPEKPHTTDMAGISPKSGSVSRIIFSYKSAVSEHAHRLQLTFGWQERFYDHIIRDDAAYDRITNYILSNPNNWDK